MTASPARLLRGSLTRARPVPAPPARRAAWLVAAALLLAGLAGCTVYPVVTDTGGVHLQPRNGRLLVDGATATFFVELASTGLYGDVLYGADTPVARKSQLVGPTGEPLARLEIPGHAVVRLRADGPRIVLSDFTRPLVRGESVIVTLTLEKYRRLGVITVVE
jgi:copper(I)-binding protein